MTPWRIRDFHEDDLDAAIRLWDDPAAGSTLPVFGVSDLISAVRDEAPAVVAVVGTEVVGAVIATIGGARASVLRISLAPGWRQRGIGSAMLTGGWLQRACTASAVSFRTVTTSVPPLWSIAGIRCGAASASMRSWNRSALPMWAYSASSAAA